MRAVRRRPKYARGSSATVIAGTTATNSEPVSAATTSSATSPPRRCRAQNCAGETPAPACCNHSRCRRAPRCRRCGACERPARQHAADRAGDERAERADRERGEHPHGVRPRRLEHRPQGAARRAARGRPRCSSRRGNAPVHSSGRPSRRARTSGSYVCVGRGVGATAVISITWRRMRPSLRAACRRDRAARPDRAPRRRPCARCAR